MRRSSYFPILCSIAISAFNGCGGSGSTGGNGGGGGGGGTQSNPPVLTSIAPSSALAGGPATAILAYGSKFMAGAAIQWNGTALTTTCVDQNLISTNCATAAALSASIPASDLASVGTVQVTASNPSPGGGTSNSLLFTIAPVPTGTSWVRSVAGITVPQDVVWDSVRGNLYISVASADPAAPNTIVSVDPVAGTVGTSIAAGNNPDYLALSSDGGYLWAGLDGSDSVQRFLLPGFSKDVSFPLPVDSSNNPQQAVALQAAPVNPHTIAVIAGHWGWSPTGDGVYVYDDATQRPTHVPGFGASSGAMIDWIQWGADDSTIFGDQYTTIDQGGIATMNVTSSGVSLTSYKGNGLNPTISQYVKSNGILYSYGGAYDPVKLTQVGQFDLPETGDEACTADASLGRYYCITEYSNSGVDVYLAELWVFDLNSYALLDREYFGWLAGEGGANQPNSSITGSPMKLVRWGNAGLALITTSGAQSGIPVSESPYGAGGVFLIDGAAVNPNSSPDVTSGSPPQSYPWLSSMSPQSATAGSTEVTLTINGTGFSPDSTACWNCNFLQFRFLPTTYVSPTQLNVMLPVGALPTNVPVEMSVFNQNAKLFSSNALTFTVLPSSSSTQITPLNLCGLSMAWDATSQLLYVGTADYDGAHPNSIVAVNGATGAIAKVQTVEPDPIFLSDGASGDYLYAAYAGATNLTQLALPNLSITATGVLNNSQSGPWTPGDLKAAPQDPHTTAVTLIKPGWSPQSLGGVVVFDDGVARPDFAPGWTGGQTVPAMFDELAWSASDSILASSPGGADGGGPLYTLQVNPSGVAYLTEGTASFNDRGEIHSDFGTGLIYSDDGEVADPSTGAIVGNYNASGLVTPDSSLNRVFILGQTAAQANSFNFTIDSFDQKAFTPVSSITLNNLSGSPIQLVRWGTSGLAVLTTGGLGDLSADGLGMLYLIEDSKFVSNLQPTSNGQAAKLELVKMRWKRLSKREMLNAAHQTARHQTTPTE